MQDGSLNMPLTILREGASPIKPRGGILTSRLVEAYHSLQSHDARVFSTVWFLADLPEATEMLVLRHNACL